MVVAERRFDQEPQGPPRVATVQKAVNYARKLDTKITRIRREQAARDKKWESYKVAMKQAFHKERLKYAKDQQRLMEDLKVALSEQEEAHRLMEQAALSLKVREPEEPMQVEDTEWDEMVREQAIPTGGLQRLEAEVRELVERRQAQQGPVQTPTRPTAATPRTPGQNQRTTAHPEQAVMPGPPSDPYLMTAPTPLAVSSETPESRAFADLQQELRRHDAAVRQRAKPKGPEGQRQSVKALPAKVVHTPSPSRPLEARLERRRAAILQETQQPRAATTQAEQRTAQDAGPAIFFVNDDEDEDLEDVLELEADPPPEVD